MRPTEVLSKEHRVIERGLAVLEEASFRLGAGREVPKDTLKAILDFIRGFADRCHHRKEEDILFPYLEGMGLSREDGPVGVMLEEHETGRAHVQAMSEALEDSKPLEFVAHSMAYIRLLRDHIAKEDSVLFPMADQIIGEEEEDLLTSFERAETELAGAHERYLNLLKQLEEELGVGGDT